MSNVIYLKNRRCDADDDEWFDALVSNDGDNVTVDAGDYVLSMPPDDAVLIGTQIVREARRLERRRSK